MRLLVITSMMVIVGACGSPATDPSLDPDNATLPDRTPATDAGYVDVSNDTASDHDSARGPDLLGLTVTLAGPATGTITSTPSGLACVGATCKGSFLRGTSVTLTAAPAAGAMFGGWSGGCSGAASCVAKLDVAVAAIADFEPLDGTWSGTYTNTRVATGCTFNNAGDSTVSLKTGAASSSSATVTGLQLKLAAPSCFLVNTTTTGAAPDSPVAIAADTLTGTWTVALKSGGTPLAFPFTAKVVGNTLAGTWTCPTCTGSFTLTKD